MVVQHDCSSKVCADFEDRVAELEAVAPELDIADFRLAYDVIAVPKPVANGGPRCTADELVSLWGHAFGVAITALSMAVVSHQHECSGVSAV